MESILYNFSNLPACYCKTCLISLDVPYYLLYHVMFTLYFLGDSGVCFGVDRFDPGREITERIGTLVETRGQ